MYYLLKMESEVALGQAITLVKQAFMEQLKSKIFSLQAHRSDSEMQWYKEVASAAMKMFEETLKNTYLQCLQGLAPGMAKDPVM